MTDAQAHVVIVAADGSPLATLTTNRDAFALVATWGRDRVFQLAHVGSLGLDPFGNDVHGALYVEADAWRITMKSIDKPTGIRRRRVRPSATIIPFPDRAGEVA